MAAAQPEHRTGLEALHAATSLLQRIRGAHPTASLFEAADLQWWWRTPRSTDSQPQLFWFDQHDRPVAAVIFTAWDDDVAFDPIVLPDASPAWIAHVVEQGLAHAERCSVQTLALEVDATDEALRGLLAGHGFTVGGGEIVEAWLAPSTRPVISPLHPGYRLCSRADVADEPHHMIGRNGPEVEARLRQTSLYRPDLDLVVHDEHGQAAAYGLFWYDPETATGLVEPMRTEDAHQRQGLARHVLTAGVHRLRRAGAERVKICYEPANPASGHLYRSVGFEPTRTTITMSRSAR